MGMGKPSLPPVNTTDVYKDKFKDQKSYLREVEKGVAANGTAQGHPPESNFKENLGAFVDSFTAHGISKIYNSQRWSRRLLWILVCLFMVVFGTYQCYRVISEYLTYPKKVTITVEEDPIAEFPAVTVCNLNSLANKEALVDHPMWGAFVEIEDENKQPICEGLSYGTYDYEDEHYYEYTEDGSDYGDPADEDPGEEEYYEPENSWQPTWDEDGNIQWENVEPEDDSTVSTTEATSTLTSSSTIDSTSESTLSTESTSESTLSTDSTTGSTLSSDSTTGSTLSVESTSESTLSSDSTTGSTLSTDSTSESTLSTDSTTGSTYSTISTTSNTFSTDSTTENTLSSDSTTGSSTVSTGSTSGSTLSTASTLSGSPSASSTDGSTSSGSTSSASTTGSTSSLSSSASTTSSTVVSAGTTSTTSTLDGTTSSVTTTGSSTTTAGVTASSTSESDGTTSTTLTSDGTTSSPTGSATVLLRKREISLNKKKPSMKGLKESRKKHHKLHEDIYDDKNSGIHEKNHIIYPDAESTLPQPTPARDYVMDFATFTERNWKKFTLLTNPGSHRRSKRSTGEQSSTDSKKEPARLTKSEVRKYREECSLYYKYLMYLQKEDSITSGESVKFDDEQPATCPVEEYREDVTFNPLCRLEIFCDNYGCFDYNLRDYKEVVKFDQYYKEVTRCPSCSSDCWPLSYFKKWENGTFDAMQVYSMFQNSRTPDFSDILGLFAPSVKDISTYSIPAKDFIQTCSLDRHPCSYKQFHAWTSDRYGLCYTFNSAFRKITLKNNKTVMAKPRKTSSVGPRNGIRLTLNIKTTSYLSLLSPDVGARVIIHSPRRLPFPEEEGFNISPGLGVSISISRKKIERVAYPYGNCEDKAESEKFKEYSPVTCRKMCLEREYWKSCGCAVGQSPVYSDSGFGKRPSIHCSPFNVSQKICMETVMFSYQQRFLVCDCPPSCKETKYISQVTSSEDNRKFYTIVQNIKKLVSGSDLCSGGDNGTVRLHLYLDSLSYEKIHEFPAYTWDTLICNIGGNLGLFIGMSLVTMVELLEFLFDFFFVWGCSSKKNDRNAKVTHVDPVPSQPPGRKGDTPSAQVMLQDLLDEVPIRRRGLDHNYANVAFDQAFLK